MGPPSPQCWIHKERHGKEQISLWHSGATFLLLKGNRPSTPKGFSVRPPDRHANYTPLSQQLLAEVLPSPLAGQHLTWDTRDAKYKLLEVLLEVNYQVITSAESSQWKLTIDLLGCEQLSLHHYCLPKMMLQVFVFHSDLAWTQLWSKHINSVSEL